MGAWRGSWSMTGRTVLLGSREGVLCSIHGDQERRGPSAPRGAESPEGGRDMRAVTPEQHDTEKAAPRISNAGCR